MLIDTGSNRTIIRSNVINIHDQRINDMDELKSHHKKYVQL